MRAGMITHKIILSFLNILLVVGAILSIATIDHGRWITSYLTFFSSGEVWGHSTQTQNIHANGRVGTEGKATSQGQGACVVVSQLLNPDWFDTYLLVSAYNKAENSGNHPAGGAERQVVCGK